MSYNGWIDLRSDTVTRPTAEMRKAMADAEVGDDVFGDDPTVISLQEYAAGLLGKDSGLFVPTGSMGNQVSLGALTRPGDEVICETDAHFLHYEGGSFAAHMGLVARPIEGERGKITAEQIGSMIRKGTEHNPHTACVAIENTHNAAGGAIFPLEEAQAIGKLCRDHGVAMHIDGARIFNAQAATGTPVKEWADCADTVTFCFSKGLGAPVGSMVCGSSDVIAEAHRLRKRLGGGMRQVGVIAAAARVALETGPERLREDHLNAQKLAEGLAELNPAAVDPKSVETNMIYLDLAPFGMTSGELTEALKGHGITTLGGAWTTIRLVTHRDVTSDDIDKSLEAFRSVLKSS